MMNFYMTQDFQNNRLLTTKNNIKQHEKINRNFSDRLAGSSI